MSFEVQRKSWGGKWVGATGRWLRRHARLTLGFGKYVAVGLSGVIVNLGTFLLLTRTFPGAFPGPLLLSAASFVMALLWNFTWNFHWTFRGQDSRPLLHHLFLYSLFQSVSLAVNLVVLAGSLRVGLPSLYGQGAGILGGSLWGYGANWEWNFISAPSRRTSSHD
jgi:putative flippase GtrA